MEFLELHWSQIVKFFFKDSQLQAIKCCSLPPHNISSTTWAQELSFPLHTAW